MSDEKALSNSFYAWVIRNGRKDLLDAWDFSKNEIQPEAIPFDSQTEVYWKDGKGGCYLASVASMTKTER